MMAWLKKWWQRLRRRQTTEIKRVAWYTDRRAKKKRQVRRG